MSSNIISFEGYKSAQDEKSEISNLLEYCDYTESQALFKCVAKITEREDYVNGEHVPTRLLATSYIGLSRFDLVIPNWTVLEEDYIDLSTYLDIGQTYLLEGDIDIWFEDKKIMLNVHSFSDIPERYLSEAAEIDHLIPMGFNELTII
jgi:hypothetical protein